MKFSWSWKIRKISKIIRKFSWFDYQIRKISNMKFSWFCVPGSNQENFYQIRKIKKKFSWFESNQENFTLEIFLIWVKSGKFQSKFSWFDNFFFFQVKSGKFLLNQENFEYFQENFKMEIFLIWLKSGKFHLKCRSKFSWFDPESLRS